MKKKSLLALLALAVACLLLFISCGGKTSTDADNPEDTTASTQPEAELSSVIYEYSDWEANEGKGAIRYTFFYNESNTVKKAIVEWTTDVSLPGNAKEGLEHLYSEAQSANGGTGVYEYSYTQDGNIHTLKIEFDFSDERAITTFKSGFLHIYTDGTTVTLEAVESAVNYAGYVKVEE